MHKSGRTLTADEVPGQSQDRDADDRGEGLEHSPMPVKKSGVWKKGALKKPVAEKPGRKPVAEKPLKPAAKHIEKVWKRPAAAKPELLPPSKIPAAEHIDKVLKRPAAAKPEVLPELATGDAAEVRDPVKGRLFNSLWDRVQSHPELVPDWVHQYVREIKMSKGVRGSNYRQDMTWLVNNIYEKDDASGKLVLRPQQPKFQHLVQRYKSTYDDRHHEGKIFEVAKRECGGEQELAAAVSRGAVKVAGQGAGMLYYFPHQKIGTSWWARESITAEREKAIDSKGFDQIEAEIGELMDNNSQSEVHAGSSLPALQDSNASLPALLDIVKQKPEEPVMDATALFAKFSAVYTAKHGLLEKCIKQSVKLLDIAVESNYNTRVLSSRKALASRLESGQLALHEAGWLLKFRKTSKGEVPSKHGVHMTTECSSWVST